MELSTLLTRVYKRKQLTFYSSNSVTLATSFDILLTISGYCQIWHGRKILRISEGWIPYVDPKFLSHIFCVIRGFHACIWVIFRVG